MMRTGAHFNDLCELSAMLRTETLCSCSFSLVLLPPPRRFPHPPLVDE
jgi:hypothetical protein